METLPDNFKIEHTRSGSVYSVERVDNKFHITWPDCDEGCFYSIVSVEGFIESGAWRILPQASINFTHRAHPDTVNSAQRQHDGYWLVSWGDRGNGVKNQCYYQLDQVRHFIASGEWSVVSVAINSEGGPTHALVSWLEKDNTLTPKPQREFSR